MSMNWAGRHDVLHGLDDGHERRFGGDDLDEVAVLCTDDMDAVAELLDATVSGSCGLGSC
jgi:hypothetical protein